MQIITGRVNTGNFSFVPDVSDGATHD